MLKIGVLGVGHLGKIHLKCIQQAEAKLNLVGFYDPDEATAQEVANNFQIKRFENLDELIEQVDIVDIVTPTVNHFEMASRAIKKGKHIFIEKPLTHTLEEAEQLLELAKEFGIKVQVGHVERFNPAFLALGNTPLQPMFIEAHRLATFNPRGTDVSVVLDLMIHDLDLLLSLVNSEVKSVSATGVAVVSESPDISNARIEFENGCIANVTASRMSLKQMRKLRLFQKDAYISLDFLDKQAQVVRLYEKGSADIPSGANLMELPTKAGTKMIHIDMPEIEQTNAIKMELETFATSIAENTRPRVSIEDGYKALKLAYQIVDEIEKRTMEIEA